ncbi:MAG: hypothetical protein KDK41_12440 [Leptospiraceae bacterium]|nr:hypothetical protein [Leptospiraceae bacterium]
MKKALILLCIASLTLAGLNCKKPGPPGKSVTITEACSPENYAEIIKGDTVGPRLAISGYLGLSTMFSMVSTTIMVDLFEKPGRQGKSMKVSLRYNKGKNSMNKLPKKYKYEDLIVETLDGEELGINDKVTVHGEQIATDSTSCIVIVDRIEKAK